MNASDETKLPERKQIRLQQYDYARCGMYFLTICSADRRRIFSQIVGALHESPAVRLLPCGEIVQSVLEILPKRFEYIEIVDYVIMPDHIHLIVWLKSDERAIHESPLQNRSDIPKIMGFFKMNVSKKIHALYPNLQVWQRSYFDHVIRNHEDLSEIRQYIHENPRRWEIKRSEDSWHDADDAAIF